MTQQEHHVSLADCIDLQPCFNFQACADLDGVHADNIHDPFW